ncbi:DUF2244 domain-containing protein [Aureimonas sp. ME7]|uniref:DUF2244 domain-containing protein n=1 Tax=Aureimonas sp. ME7 TaxID=2744252 RepID=UPI0015F6577F|nr:DUF2244 domain-containing protein [Aureimonas sp. ME7]
MPESAETPLFHALLTPYRSLGTRGFNVTMALFGGASVLSCAIFIANGAWPVVGFFGLDVFLLWLALKASFRSAKASEEVLVSRTELAIVKTSAKGHRSEARYNPFWTRFLVRRHQLAGVTHMAVAAEGRQTEIGAFLNPDDRESFAEAFTRALNEAKRG